ncbi:MAG: DNA polymerase, partial [Pseudomonadota bacterium]
DVLEELDAMGESEVPHLILDYRELDKLLSTYVKTLPQMINPGTKRLHTTFNQNVAVTGRLSSDHPNLQNIPFRTEMGRRIRKGFIARPGRVLLSADYSQIELRLLAHFSEDPVLVNAFKRDEDVHTQTAAEILGIPISQVSSQERSRAKTVNFGLMYGQSSFGLSQTLKIGRGEAKDYITRYFEKFSRVKGFLDSLKEFCELNGFVQTLLGRRRYLPDIHNQNRTVKAMAERMAINAPIQGTAADLIKVAMIHIANEMAARHLQSKMLLQVHDELIFEVSDEEIEIMKSLVKDKMENAAQLRVPLKVEMGIGINWYDLK